MVTGNPRMVTGLSASLVHPRFHMGIMRDSSPLPYGDPHMVVGTRYHTGTVQSLTHYHTGIVSIWGLWKKSPYGNNYHMGITVTIWGSPYGFR